MAVVTISRLLGAGGDTIARRVAEKLGYNVVDTGLIARVAERAGVSVERVRDYDERSQSRAVEWLKGFINPKMGKILAHDVEQIDPKTFVEYAKTIIRGLAEQGNMVIVGRASQFILQDWETAYHVRIIADEPFRIARVSERKNIPQDQARDMIHKIDAMRRNYVVRYFGKDPENPSVYHQVIDSGKNGIDDTVSIITESVRRFGKSHEFIPGVRDRRTHQRRNGHERRCCERRTGVESWTQKDIQSAVMRGRPIRSRTTPDRRQTKRRSGNDRRHTAE